MYIQETHQLLTVAFWKKTREHVSIIYCSLSFYLSCIDLLMMYDRSICANCNFRWEHFPLSKFIAEVILEFAVIGEQTVVCKVLELYAKGRGGRLGYTEMLRAVTGLITTVIVQVRGEKTILTSGFARKCLCMYLEWHKRIWLSQQLK